MQFTPLLQYAVVALGGALGAMTRYSVSNLPIFGEDKYYTTVVINVSGCLIMGILWALFSHYSVNRAWYLFVLTGILGGYTTYSAFTLDAMQLVEKGMVWRAVYYMGITIVEGIGVCAIGLFGTDKLLKYFG